jgi:carbonic anhydrase
VTYADDLLAANASYANDRQHAPMSHKPAQQLAVVACMDCRVPPVEVLGLKLGDAHVMRNAGAVASDDVIRSLAISQRLMDTRHVVVMVHTGCGMLNADEPAFRRRILEETGQTPPWSMQPYTNLEADLRSSLQRLRTSPFLPYRDSIHGFVYDTETGRLTLVRD